MRQLALLLIGLFFGGGIGFLIAASQGVTLDGHDHSDPTHHGADHADTHDMGHTPVDLPAGPDAPTLSAALAKDAKGGWNLHIVTTHFRFTPQAVNGTNVPGEGHAHVYVDGTKIARAYGPWLHIAQAPAGATVTVELNANDHAPLSVGGTPLSVSLTVPSQ